MSVCHVCKYIIYFYAESSTNFVLMFLYGNGKLYHRFVSLFADSYSSPNLFDLSSCHRSVCFNMLAEK